MGKLKTIFCAVFRHSNIEDVFFGYHYCGRCRTQVGDSLGGVWENKQAVIIGHNCKMCRKNYKKLNLIDKLFVANPLGKPQRKSNSKPKSKGVDGG